MTTVVFLKLKNVLRYHVKLIERYGGSHGVRDQGALLSALAAAQNRHAYEDADLATCAATYAYHLSQAHAFIDGNKRIAWGAALLFLQRNGIYLTVSESEGEEFCLGIADGQTTREGAEQRFTQWIKSLA
jgi:death on curing protein